MYGGMSVPNRRVALGACGLVFALLTNASLSWAYSPGHPGGSAEAPMQGERASRAQPADLAQVAARVQVLRSELELLRYEMGAPATNEIGFDVHDVELREVYFQALTLVRKADRLLFEQLRGRLSVPATLPEPVRAGDVLGAVDHALEGLLQVKRAAGITGSARETPRAGEGGPTELFLSLLQANRQLNLLLEYRFTPSDVHEQITLAIGYASRLLRRFRAGPTIPPEPPLERGKRPADVYVRMLGCLEKTGRIAGRSGLQMLSLGVGSEALEQITPSDVFDLASLLVSELAFLEAQAEESGPPIETYYPGRVFPSHAFQRAGILQSQLEELEGLVEQNPRWLKNGTTGS